eukprot:5375949-Prymnesium_polylepis.1
MLFRVFAAIAAYDRAGFCGQNRSRRVINKNGSTEWGQTRKVSFAALYRMHCSRIVDTCGSVRHRLRCSTAKLHARRDGGSSTRFLAHDEECTASADCARDAATVEPGDTGCAIEFGKCLEHASERGSLHISLNDSLRSVDGMRGNVCQDTSRA